MLVVNVFKALASEMRVRMVHLLKEYDLNVTEIMQVLDIRQSRASRHLKVLSEAGLLESQREGLCCFYRLSGSDEGKALVNALTPLFDREPVLAKDLRRAEEVRARRMAETRQFFDEIAGEWDKVNQAVMGGFDLHGAVAGKVPACGTLVDLGCGPGTLLALIEDKAERFIGVDSSPGMLKLAGRRFNGNSRASLRLGDLCHLPMGDGEADAAVMCMVLHHLPEPGKALAEAARIVRPGGLLVIAEFEKHENEEMRKALGDLRLGFNHDEMKRMLDENGFSVDSHTEYGVNKGLAVFVSACVRT